MTADDLAIQLKKLINGWQKRYVPYTVWQQAWDIVEEMVVLDMARAVKAGELLMAEYDKWVAVWCEGPDWAWAQRTEQGRLL